MIGWDALESMDLEPFASLPTMEIRSIGSYINMNMNRTKM